jgi:hypothetical protein
VNMNRKQQRIGKREKMSSNHDPLIFYHPQAVARALKTVDLTPVEIAEKSNGAFSFQWLYGLLAGDYPRARRSKLIALASTIDVSLNSLTVD